MYDYCGLIVTIYKPGLKAANMGFHFNSFTVVNVSWPETSSPLAGAGSTFGIPSAYGPFYNGICSVGIDAIGFTSNNAQRTIYFNPDPVSGFTNIHELSPRRFSTSLHIFCLI